MKTKTYKLTCPACKRNYTVPAEAFGRRNHCNGCGHRWVVPTLQWHHQEEARWAESKRRLLRIPDDHRSACEVLSGIPSRPTWPAWLNFMFVMLAICTGGMSYFIWYWIAPAWYGEGVYATPVPQTHKQKSITTNYC